MAYINWNEMGEIFVFSVFFLKEKNATSVEA